MVLVYLGLAVRALFTLIDFRIGARLFVVQVLALARPITPNVIGSPPPSPVLEKVMNRITLRKCKHVAERQTSSRLYNPQTIGQSALSDALPQKVRYVQVMTGAGRLHLPACSVNHAAKDQAVAGDGLYPRRRRAAWTGNCLFAGQSSRGARRGSYRSPLPFYSGPCSAYRHCLVIR